MVKTYTSSRKLKSSKRSTPPQGSFSRSRLQPHAQTHRSAKFNSSFQTTAETLARGHRFSQIALSQNSSFSIQPKLTVGQPNDQYEQEADRVADQVMRMPAPAASSVELPGQRKAEMASPLIQRMCAECEEEVQRQPMDEEDKDMLLQTKADSRTRSPNQSSNLSNGIASLQQGGQPLSASDRAFFEPRFGADFSQVRLHTDTQAAKTAKSINARAFTYRHNIVFGAGQYDATNARGQQLLAHELTHVIQQTGSRQPEQTASAYSAGAPAIQRAHELENDPATAPGIDCPIATSLPGGTGLDISFSVNSPILDAAARAGIAHFKDSWHATGASEPVRVDGFASIDGSPSTNWPLSCQRAKALAHQLQLPETDSSGAVLSPGIPERFIDVFAQGETQEFSAVALSPNRKATAHIPSLGPTPTPKPPPKQKENCKDKLGTCDFYRCLSDQTPGDKESGYYWNYGYKYCNRFRQSSLMDDPKAARWVDCVTLNLQRAILSQCVKHGNDLDKIKECAYATHARVYTDCGICELDKTFITQIKVVFIPDAADLWTEAGLDQVLESAGRCFVRPFAFQAIIDRYTTWYGDLEEDRLGRYLADLARANPASNYAAILGVIELLSNTFDDDDVALEFVSALSDSQLNRLSTTSDGRRILFMMQSALKSGSTSSEEQTQIDRIGNKSRR